MARAVAFAIFAVITGAKVPDVWRSAEAAANAPSIDTIALAAYETLKLAVMGTFAILVAIRPPSARAARAPIAFVACVGAIASLVLLRGPEESAHTAVVVAGDLLTVVACLWQLVAVVALGRCFGILPEARGLVTRGPYRVVRHPVYLGELAACAGLVVAAPTLANAACAISFAFFQAIRMRLEEKALSDAFPEYAAYARSTPRLVPRVWSGGRRSPVTLTPSPRGSSAT